MREPLQGDSVQRELWRLRKRRTKRAGLTLVIVGLASFLIAIILRSFPFELMALTSFFFGFFLLFRSIDRYAKEDVAARAILSPLASLEHLLTLFKPSDQEVYIPPNHRFSEGRIFIPFSNNHRLANNNRLAVNGGTFYFDPPGFEQINPDRPIVPREGLMIIPPGSALLERIEEEFGEDLREVSLDSLVSRLPTVLVEGLELAGDVKIQRGDGVVRFEVHDMKFNHVYNHYNNNRNNNNSKKPCKILKNWNNRNNNNHFQFTRTPIYSALALTIAKNTGRYVRIAEHRFEPKKDSVHLTLHIGQKAE